MMLSYVSSMSDVTTALYSELQKGHSRYVQLLLDTEETDAQQKRNDGLTALFCGWFGCCVTSADSKGIDVSNQANRDVLLPMSFVSAPTTQIDVNEGIWYPLKIMQLLTKQERNKCKKSQSHPTTHIEEEKETRFFSFFSNTRHKICLF